MHTIHYMDRDGAPAQVALSDAVWEALVEVAESRSQSPEDICRHVEATRAGVGFAESLEVFLYRYYRAKSPEVFDGMNDGDPEDSRFDHGLKGVDKDTLFK